MPSPYSRQRRLAGALAAVLLGAPAISHAATRIEVQGGRSYMDSYGTNTAFVEAVFDAHPLGASRFTWAPDVSLGWIDGRGISKYGYERYNARPSVALAAAGARLRTTDERAWYHPVFFSLQLAGTNHTTQALSSHYQFVSTLGLQFEHVSLAIRHISNGGLHDPNRGETMALVGLGFSF
ncbi:MAG TPA: acyloxyacyl hydrolase [Ramlibacter sp.]|uniref:acyloxyacyl hydrolase n=1 Tax=Ramlibacter sp. TaxID=1917967 RepID=UPI002D806BCC|nr:acyloxyacyl hydrolase [Ramlibacter sp.]HET8745084.1 acyloxyacyl hydrolase [Ramlibacter sp.]